jgi:hypothetical protein
MPTVRRPVANRSDSRSIPALVGELWELVLAYLKQETVEPAKGLRRFVLFGVPGSLVLAIGLVIMLLGGLRALQDETGATFTGDLSWAPYGITAGGALVVVALAGWAAVRGRGRRRRRS